MFLALIFMNELILAFFCKREFRTFYTKWYCS